MGQDEPSSEAEFITTVLGCFSGTLRGTRELLQRTQAPGPPPTHHGETTPTRLRRDTARDMQVLKSSGFFLQRQVMRLTAAVTTPCRGRQVAGQGCRGRVSLGTSVQPMDLKAETQGLGG